MGWFTSRDNYEVLKRDHPETEVPILDDGDISPLHIMAAASEYCAGCSGSDVLCDYHEDMFWYLKGIEDAD